ncbi:MAG TPA: prepilin-type N-terminal cleavage/methylation domain-containing protein [Bacilli bacterium]|nr:prepilin-type N-terminal cleavage/methylation domain-containing protein [Bacilli bacterium]
MSKKGFTLIELLAVILILGIIALIAIPVVNNIITESKIGAWKSTANNVVNAYEQYAQLNELKGVAVITDFSDGTTFSGASLAGSYVKTTVGMKGELPTTFTKLMLNTNGDALVSFTEDSITCKNYAGDDAEVTTATAVTEMSCSK